MDQVPKKDSINLQSSTGPADETPYKNDTNNRLFKVNKPIGTTGGVPPFRNFSRAPESSSGGTGVSVEATLVKNRNNFSDRSSISRFVPEDESIEMLNNFLHDQTNEELLSNDLLSTLKKDIPTQSA